MSITKVNFFAEERKKLKWTRYVIQCGKGNLLNLPSYFRGSLESQGVTLGKLTMAISCPCSWKTQEKAGPQVPTWSAQPGCLQISQYASHLASMMPQVHLASGERAASYTCRIFILFVILRRMVKTVCLYSLTRRCMIPPHTVRYSRSASRSFFPLTTTIHLVALIPPSLLLFPFYLSFRVKSRSYNNF